MRKELLSIRFGQLEQLYKLKFLSKKGVNFYIERRDSIEGELKKTLTEQNE